MITEIARIEVTPGSEAAFEAAVAEVAPLLEAAKGCHGFQLQRGIERPSHYLLLVLWDSVEDHIVTFRGSPGFARWRELVGPYFAATPDVEHRSEEHTSELQSPMRISYAVFCLKQKKPNRDITINAQYEP